MTAALGVDSEVGRLRAVVLHRPGAELRRLTPRNNDRLLFDGIPWVSRAQDEHDAFAGVLRERGVEVLLLTDLLADVLAMPAAREEAVADATGDLRLGTVLRHTLADHLRSLGPQELTSALVAGIRHDELPCPSSLVSALAPDEDFVLDPLPNLLFTRDSSVWVGDRVVTTSLAMPARERETQLLALVHAHHSRFGGAQRLHGWDAEHLEGGDVLLLGAGVIAVGVGERTTPAGVESLSRAVFDAGLARTVLAVPIAQERATMHLDTVLTMVDTDAVVMYPNVAHNLVAVTVTPSGDGALVVGGRRPFLEAAAHAMGIERLRVIDTGLDPVTAEREQWDDGNNTLAVAPGVVVAYERNTETNSRLVEAGVQVLAVSGSELGSGRGGPRCMSCPVLRDPPDDGTLLP